MAGLQENARYRLADARRPRIPNRQHVESRLLQRAAKHLQLRAFPRAFRPVEHDEFAAQMLHSVTAASYTQHRWSYKPAARLAIAIPRLDRLRGHSYIRAMDSPPASPHAALK